MPKDPKPTYSPYIEVRESSIHNKGVFAKRDIPKDTYIIEYIGRKMTKEQSDIRYEEMCELVEKGEEDATVYIFELDDDYDIDGRVPWNTAQWINHSCNPNCETDNTNGHIWIKSIRDIKKGEELSYNYGYNLEDYEDHPCHCGSDNCVGYIVDEDEWPNLKKILEKKKVRKS